MLKYSFCNDYSEGAHHAILELLLKTNSTQETGYGADSYSIAAKNALQQHLGKADTEIHFVSGGTQANLIALASMLKPYESVISAETGHINIHETGAIEATGHKINTVSTVDGKLTLEDIDSIVKIHGDEHMVKPKVVFVSHSTELGSVYSKTELKSISDYCRKNGLYLYLDGARLGSALVNRDADLSLRDIAALVDMFYIGGTKNGALFGEAIVIVNPALKAYFRFHLKQRGALLAKGRAVGVQFLALFSDDLYFSLATHANAQAAKLAKEIEELGYRFLTVPATNQIFPILPNHIISELKSMYDFYVWKKIDAHCSAARLVTSWATANESVEMFLDDLKRLSRML